jgi:hypothetical protein
LRAALGRCFAVAASVVLGFRCRDTQCGMKVFADSPAVRAALRQPFSSRWIFDVELMKRICRSESLGVDGRSDLFYEWPLSGWTEIAGSRVRPKDFLVAGRELVQIAYNRAMPTNGDGQTAQFEIVALAADHSTILRVANPAA